MYCLGEAIHESVETIHWQKTSKIKTNMGLRTSGNREGLKVARRRLGGGFGPDTDVTSRNKLMDVPTHRRPPEGTSKKLEGPVLDALKAGRKVPHGHLTTTWQEDCISYTLGHCENLPMSFGLTIISTSKL